MSYLIKLGLPSVGGATESNNSNETGESPTSTASTSPINSPVLNCSASTTTNATSKQHNHSSGSTSVDYTDVKKNKVLENSITKVCFLIFDNDNDSMSKIF